jgi:3-dehydroquinate dehydratase/shikimate dehydrogenase
MKSQLVETVTADTMAELRAGRDRAVFGDLVELRVDGVRDLDVAGALEGRARGVIVTCRPVWEGGRFDGSEHERLNILSQAIRLGAEYVDVEWRADRGSLPRGDRTALVLSHHDFDGVPADLADRVRAMRAERADVTKVAVTAKRLTDCLTLKDAVAGGGRYVAIAMGASGQITRLWPSWIGSCWTFGGCAAPGQMSGRELAGTYRVQHTTAASAVYGVVGLPLAHSASPAMHNAAFAAAGLDAVYLPIETADADELLAVADAIGLRGASVTAPLKRTLFERTRPASPLPRQLGAVNTLRRSGRGWEADNFDVAGFLAPLDRRPGGLRGRRAVVLGAGGAARAAVWALKANGAHVEVAARRAGEAARLAADLQVSTSSWPPAAGWHLLVNATPVGTWPHVEESPMARELVAGDLVYDLVYNPLETTLLRWARAAKSETIGGLEMLVSQACRQFEWWTGQQASLAAVERAAIAFIQRPRDVAAGL